MGNSTPPRIPDLTDLMAQFEQDDGTRADKWLAHIMRNLNSGPAQPVPQSMFATAMAAPSPVQIQQLAQQMQMGAILPWQT